MSISDVIVVVEKKYDMFWNLDMMRSKPPNLKDVNIPRVKLAKNRPKANIS